ncbi:dihydropyrimidinase [Anaerostipes sp.]|uniref:dihydropyrimidinase n=1 Tax=Anaerostipes sp. TaxID=1872530 RepID=UPI0025C2682D|nr:dihydropyrimidinase [Anaerostipes sp.]MBS7007776.1 dihydropyrimidinase [Anaerostipes sp.]
MKYLLKNGTIVSGDQMKKADVLIEDEKILKTGPDLTDPEAVLVDAAGKLLFPGFIDAHTHFQLEVSGTVTADNFDTGTRAAIKGGTTMVIDFATQYKGETLEEALQNWHQRADNRSSCDYSFHMAVSDWNEETSKSMEHMMEEGITSFKMYMTYPDMILDDHDIFMALRRMKEIGGITGVHCENSGMIAALTEEAKKRGDLGADVHPKVRPESAEAEAVNRLLAIAGEVDIPVIVVHLTCQEALNAVERAREKGQTVFAETCPQYLLLDDTLYENEEGRNYICSPPLRKKENQKVLWEGLKSGKIQTVATDHCSFTTEQKDMGKDDFTKTPNGMPGVETRGILLYTYGVEKGILTPQQMCRVLSENPAKLYGVYPRKGCIQPGSDADIAVLRPDWEDVITAEGQEQNVDYSPFEGMKIKGTIDKVFLRGCLVTDKGRVIKEKQGKFIKRGPHML